MRSHDGEGVARDGANEFTSLGYYALVTRTLAFPPLNLSLSVGISLPHLLELFQLTFRGWRSWSTESYYDSCGLGYALDFDGDGAF